MSKIMPRLTLAGFARILPERVNSAMMDFYLAKYSQTCTSRGNMRPLAWLIANYGDKPNMVATQIADTLRDYLRGIFDDATVEITPEEVDARLNLKANILVREDGHEYSIGHVIQVSQSQLLSVFDMINNGVIYDPLKDLK